MRSPEAILDLYKTRKATYALLHSKMQTVADIYNGKATVPLPDMEREDTPSIPNLLAQGVDQMAGRITSVTPQVTFSSTRPGVRIADRRAQDAGRTVTGWWQMDRLPIKMKQRGRRLIAYGMAPVVMRWNYSDHRPIWQVRHPLETFPSPDLEPGKVKPEDCIFTFKRTAGWLIANGYDQQLWRLTDRDNIERDSIVTLIEYIDKDHTVLMATGYYPSNTYYQDEHNTDIGGLKGIVLEAYENPSEEMPVCIPTRLTLDSMTGQFDGMIGMYYQQAKLMALETIAVEKGIFPDTYIISRPGEMGRFIEGPHDGRTGLVNIIQGGDIREMQTSPGYLTNPTIDRLERAQRVTAGIPQEFGGESGSNIRTGRRGDAVLSAVIDYPVAEAQEMFAYALEEENEIAIAFAKKVDGDTQRTIYVGTGNSRRPVTYTPNKTFETDEHVVSYPAAGSDVNSLIIGLGQRVGLGTMSKETAQQLDPFIENPEAEHDKIIAEGLEQALVAGIQQQASSGAIPPLTLSKVMTLVRNDKLELAEALVKVAEDAAAEEAAKQAAPPDPGTPQTADQMAAGATTQALAGVQDPQATMPGMANLSQMLGNLRRPAMTVQPMRGVARGAV
jgi:hypothetical protein